MAETSERDRKKLFVEIMKSTKEYSMEDIPDPETIKQEIIELLKIRRPVKLADYEYGRSIALKKDHRLIVKEKEEPSKVREYLKIANIWQCSNRTSKRQKCTSSDLIIKYGIVFAPINHSSICETRDYSFAIEVQKLLEDGKLKEARGLINRKKVQSNTSNASLSASMLDESTLLTITDTGNQSILDQYISNDTTASINANSTPPASESSARSSVKAETNENDECTVLEPPAKRPKLESNDGEIYSFDHPSASVLKEMCKKLKIDYNHDAYKLWGDIIFQKIVPESDNVQRHEFKHSNIFACFSLFFTGNIKSTYLIQNTLNNAFYDRLLASDNVSCSEADQIFLDTSLSKEQLEFIANFLSCRIGIYEGGKLKKYGKWETENNALTLILLFAYGMYSVVLDL